jgi:hypothetical protein
MIIKWSGAQAVRACGHVVSAPARDELLVDFSAEYNKGVYGSYCRALTDSLRLYAYNELTFITVSSVVRTEVNIMLESNVGHKNIEQSPERRIIANRRTAARSLRPDAPGRDPDPESSKNWGERDTLTHTCDSGPGRRGRRTARHDGDRRDRDADLRAEILLTYRAE